jgi:hypothetical protein
MPLTPLKGHVRAMPHPSRQAYLFARESVSKFFFQITTAHLVVEEAISIILRLASFSPPK